MNAVFLDTVGLLALWTVPTSGTPQRRRPMPASLQSGFRS